jgi:energy-coupling factor transport system permease protein
VRLFTPLVPDPSAPLGRANPLARIGAALALMAILFVSVDPVTPAVVLAVLVACVPFTGLSPRTLLARGWPLLVLALVVGVLNAVFGPQLGGGTAQPMGPFEIGPERLRTGLALGLRLLAIALAGLLALASTDPTDLADALVQQLRVSPRFAVGSLAALRLVPIVADEWQTIALARRARGVEAGRSPLEAVRIVAGALLALLVAAVRRATRLAIAMEARGFGSRDCRTIARPVRMRSSDWALVGGGILIAAGAVAASVALGSWRFLFSG